MATARNGEQAATLEERPNKRARISIGPEDEPKVTVSSNHLDSKAADAPENLDGEDDIENGEVEAQKPSDLYLDTINRLVLDFDFEKLCSVSLSNIHVYGCLVCGKYFQGRGKASYAYAHSVHEDHHVFMNLESSKVYVLPDGYEVTDPSLTDIVHVLHPTFTRASISELRTKPLIPSYDLSQTSYIPGYIGLNNIKHNDHLNVVVHLLAHVPPLRDVLLLTPAPSHTHTQKLRQTELLKRFATLTKKMWSPTLFKAQVSPHEFLQEVNRVSKGRFRLEAQGDPAEFLSWILNTLHIDFGGSPKRANSSIIYSSFRGTLRLESQNIKAASTEDAKPIFDTSQMTSNSMPFLLLALDLPPAPIFQDAVEKNIIPQVTLQSLLAKYDGSTTQEALGVLKRHKLTSLPPYIILNFKRFTKNNFVEEKNPTIVNFPLRGVDFRDYLATPPKQGISTTYDLLSNITHESTAGTTRDKANTVWKIHLRAGAGGGDQEKWFQIQDLIVEQVQKEMIFLGETVLQVWERRDLSKGNPANKKNGGGMDVDRK